MRILFLSLLMITFCAPAWAVPKAPDKDVRPLTCDGHTAQIALQHSDQKLLDTVRGLKAYTKKKA